MTVLYKADPVRGAQWAALFAQRAPDVPFRVWPDIGDPHAIRYLVAWNPGDLVRTLPNLEAVFSAGAGVDQLDLANMPAHLPVVGMIEPDIVEGMVEYVSEAVLAIHRDLFDYALARGQLHGAVLDVTDPEPLPPEHPLWTQPRVRITPHIASATRPDTAVDSLIDNLRRHRAGKPMIGLINRQPGY
ncbi:NAD(P)-dependent oxidoreductase [Paraburkholderia sacchari]|uniref:NAD(P)-dependent oxidoreductase n=1 Tax=Paraburkholderia sacchari TaxID=159450 RepID=UPI000543ECB8|nr:NAD(P)-dependent oxidoreductase [Paraburkholderia sacchari]NLP63377.1 hypothetical protein [Paraburkholderia sacchari]